MDSMIVCPEPLAAKAGEEIFAAGGNAVDAAVAAAFVQGVVNPLLCGLGGTGLFYYHDQASQRGTVLNCEVAVGSRPVPAEWLTEYVGRAETIGRYILISERNQVGHQSVMIPGFVAGCWSAYQRFGSGKLSWAELLSPAIQLAKDGFEVYPYIAAFWKVDSGGDASRERPGYPGLLTKLAATPAATAAYLKEDGNVYRTGDWLVQPDYAQTLQRLADAGGDDFYRGELAAQIMRDFDANDALFSATDLAAYEVLTSEPLAAPYRSYTISTTRPTSSGPQLIEMLRILEHFDVAALGHNSPDYIDLFARVQRAGFSDNMYVKGLSELEGERLAAMATSPERAWQWAESIRNGDRVIIQGEPIEPGTTHLTAIDNQRNVVSFTHSIGSGAGSGVVSPGLGFLFNNFLGHFNPLPGRPDSIEPGKRVSGVLPAIVFKDGAPYVGIGAPGGSRIITSVAQAIVNVLDFGMDMDTAVSVPRFHSEEDQLLYLEPAFAEETAEDLERLGNAVQRSTYMSRVQAVRVLPEGRLEAGADPRGGRGVGWVTDA